MNVRVAERVPDVAELLADDVAGAEAELGDHGRVLVRGQRHRAARAGDGRGADGGDGATVANDLAAVVRRRFA